jgi:DNA repair exonuclease SbcCD ATPase subunit
MDSWANQPKQSFSDPQAFQEPTFKNPTPEMNLVNYINEVDYKIATSNNGNSKAPSVILINPAYNENQEHQMSEKSLLGDNDLIAVSIAFAAIILLIVFFSNNNQLTRSQQYQLALQERQDKLVQQNLQYQLAQQAQQYQYIQQTRQHQLAQQSQQAQTYQQSQEYQLAQQAQQNQVLQQDQQYQLAQQAQGIEQDKLSKQYRLMKEAQDASSSTTTAVKFNMNW